MTREEAKSTIINKVKPCIDGTEWGEALDMAIKALSTEPREDATLKDIFCMGCEYKETGWIPLKTRPMTEEETEHYFEYTDMRIDDTYIILDCPLPDDGQEVLVSCGDMVCVDTFVKDNDGCYFEGLDIDDVEAWMPLPEPYKAEREE